MLRALVWKEWREQRPLLLSGLVLAALWPLFMIAFNASSSRPLDLASVAEALPIAYALVLWPLFAVAAGASTIANEIGDRTLEYLLSRPVSRARVWAVKLAVGAAAALAIVAGSMIVIALLRGLAFGQDRVIAPVSDLMQEIQAGAIIGITVAGGSFLLFSFAVFFSSFLPRAMTAAAAGMGASIAVFAIVSALWSRLDLVPRIEPQWMALELGVIGAIVLLASLFVFSRGEMLRGRGVAGTAALASLLIVGAGGVVLVPLVYAQLRLTAASAVMMSGSLSPSGDAFAMTVGSTGLGPSEVWLVHADSPGFTRLAGRFTFGPAFSPDGKWVAYLSNRTTLGLRAENVDLRAARIDGSDDRLLAADALLNFTSTVYMPRRLAFSPDGSRVAVNTYRGLLVASMEGAAPVHIDVVRPPYDTILGWTRDGKEIIAPGEMAPGHRATIRAFDAVTGRERGLYESEASLLYDFWQWRPSAKGIGFLPLSVERESSGSKERQLGLLDVTSGITRTLTTSGCFARPTLSEDDRHAAYASCAGVHGTDRRSEIHLVDLKSGEDRSLGSVEGEAFQLIFSPGADRILVGRRFSLGTPISDVIIDTRGSIRTLDAGWLTLGWAGRDRVLLQSYGEESATKGTRLSVLNVETGAMLDVYP